MASLEAMTRQLALIRKSVDPPKPPVQNFLDGDEWPQILAVIRRVLPAFPDALQATEQAIASLPHSMSSHDVCCVVGHALWPFLDARIELAEALMQLSKQREGE